MRVKRWIKRDILTEIICKSTYQPVLCKWVYSVSVFLFAFTDENESVRGSATVSVFLFNLISKLWMALMTWASEQAQQERQAPEEKKKKGTCTSKRQLIWITVHLSERHWQSLALSRCSALLKWMLICDQLAVPGSYLFIKISHWRNCLISTDCFFKH